MRSVNIQLISYASCCFKLTWNTCISNPLLLVYFLYILQNISHYQTNNSFILHCSMHFPNLSHILFLYKMSIKDEAHMGGDHSHARCWESPEATASCPGGGGGLIKQHVLTRDTRVDLLSSVQLGECTEGFEIKAKTGGNWSLPTYKAYLLCQVLKFVFRIRAQEKKIFNVLFIDKITSNLFPTPLYVAKKESQLFKK